MTDEESLQRRTAAAGERTPLADLPLHSTDLLTLLDPSGIVRYESPSIERLYGFDQEELVGEQVAEYFHPEDRERVLEAFEAIVESDDGRTETVEYRHLQADGSYKWIESVASANPTPEGTYVVNSRDVSERKGRERALRDAREEVRAERDGKEAIRQLLLETATDGEIAASVCRLLVDSYGYAGAWVVRTDGNSDGTVSPTEVAADGSHGGFRRGTGEADGGLDEATHRALAASGPVVATTADGVDSADSEDGDGALVARLEASGLSSVRAVPLVHDGVSTGALTVVREELGGDVPEQLVDEIATALAFKQQVNRQQDALAAETVIELQIRIESEHTLAALSGTAGVASEARLVAEELQSGDDGRGTYLVRSSGVDAETLVAAAGAQPAVDEATVVTETDERVVVHVGVDAPTAGSVLRGHGGIVQSTTAWDGRVDLTVQLPRRTDVRRAVDAISDHWPEATIRSRHEVAVEDERPAPLDGLTDKQADALRAATLAGFFERPQGATATDVAETLGVSRSTFLHHLRSAEQTVFGEAFGTDVDGA